MKIVQLGQYKLAGNWDGKKFQLGPYKPTGKWGRKSV